MVGGGQAHLEKASQVSLDAQARAKELAEKSKAAQPIVVPDHVSTQARIDAARAAQAAVESQNAFGNPS